MKPAVIGVCSICSRPAALVIDHDHRSWFGLVRGFVCQPCNGHLGRLEKGKLGKLGNSELLAHMLHYLAFPPLELRRASYWWLKYTDVWMAKRQRMVDEVHAWLSGTPFERARH